MREKVEGNARISRRKTQECNLCGHRFDLEKAQCPSCHSWNNVTSMHADENDETMLLSDASCEPLKTIKTGIWDQCFSAEGGIVTTSVTLIGGAPGAGKSTMSLQLADIIAKRTGREVLYIGKEESIGEIKHRATRLRLESMAQIRVHPMGANTDVGAIILKRKPSAVVLDSMQGFSADPEFAVEASKRFKQYAVEVECPVIIIDHITKDGDLAGFMGLQHQVDTVMTLFPIEESALRELVVIKNRYAPTERIVLEMTERGLILGLEDIEDE